MHRVQRGLRPSLFLCLKPFVQPGHCLIHALLREREGSAFFLIVRRLFKAPGLRIYVCGKGSAVFAVVACKVIPHSLMASGLGFLCVGEFFVLRNETYDVISILSRKSSVDEVVSDVTMPMM